MEKEEKVTAEEEQDKPDQEEIEVIDAANEDEEQGKDDQEALQLKLEELEKEKNETYQRMLRLQAEYDNFKKRTQKEKEASLKYKSQDLVNELLPVVDNFERALQVEKNEQTKGIIDGITMVYNQFIEALYSAGVEEIETEGKEFDPNLHHAVMQTEDENTGSNIIVEELQKGYMLKDRVIRPAMVKVNK
ncbi:nucleotide exchange factor GrpE [Virgibacillus sp. YIM 98842]|jgi:molecular chaperone GrpE|uniref:nucleotide exchange factor GrpE n=1 Tax=Virgibacillus sp. YIM 98842 TaxID=2663533 RepID=UPI0013D92430|nr:nucleotide exchange factor GrpE [Virgibacillus sp. YIM 98842]